MDRCTPQASLNDEDIDCGMIAPNVAYVNPGWNVSKKLRMNSNEPEVKCSSGMNEMDDQTRWLDVPFVRDDRQPYSRHSPSSKEITAGRSQAGYVTLFTGYSLLPDASFSLLHVLSLFVSFFDVPEET